MAPEQPPSGRTSDGLVRAAAGGDEVAFSQLLVRHYDAVLRVIAGEVPRHLGRVLAPEDLLQETFAEAFRKLPTLRAETEASFLAWLRAIAVAKAINARQALAAQKRGGGRRPVPLHAGDSASAAGSLLRVLARQSRGPAQRAADREGAALLGSMLAALDDDHQQAIRLRYLEGASVEEAARQMGREPGAFRTLCWRALRQLRAAMSVSGETGSSSEVGRK